jgi:hypothetical protein
MARPFRIALQLILLNSSTKPTWLHVSFILILVQISFDPIDGYLPPDPQIIKQELDIIISLHLSSPKPLNPCQRL